jgi:hypothetical protein
VNGSIRIGGALVFAILIVGGSLYMRSTKASTPGVQDSNSLVSVATRTYIEPTDSDGDGISDWEEQLGARVFEAIATPTSSKPLPNEAGYEPPTTFTGKFSEAFFKDYLSGRMEDGDSLSDPQALVDRAVNAIEDAVQPRTFSRADVIVVPESGETLRAYGNAVMSASANYLLRDVNQAEVLSEALMQNDPSLLDVLSENVEAYGNIIVETRRVAVPSSLVKAHIDLLNSYEALRIDTLAMRGMFDDPLYGLARGKEYFNDSIKLIRALKDIKEYLEQNGVYYEKTEQGARLYALDIIDL